MHVFRAFAKSCLSFWGWLYIQCGYTMSRRCHLNTTINIPPPGKTSLSSPVCSIYKQHSCFFYLYINFTFKKYKNKNVFLKAITQNRFNLENKIMFLHRWRRWPSLDRFGYIFCKLYIHENYICWGGHCRARA